MSMFILVNRDTRVELADHVGEFKRFKKQICQFGEYVDPNGSGKKMVLDRPVAESMKANFESGKYGVVAVPLGHPKTAAELATLNKGEMVEMSITDDGIDAVIEVRDNDTVKAIESRNIPDVSMGFEMNYQDKKTGEFVGPLLKHVGLVVDPYIKGMRQFMPLADEVPAILFSDSFNKEKEGDMPTTDKQEDVNINAEDKVTTTEVDSDDTAVEKKDTSVDTTKVEDDTKNTEGDSLTEEQKKANELASREAAIAKKEAEIAQKEAEAKFDKLLSDGKVVPAQKEAFMALSATSSQEIHLSDNETKTVDTLLSEFIEAAPKVTLTDERGADGADGGGDKADVELTDEDRQAIKRFGLNEEEYKKNKQED